MDNTNTLTRKKALFDDFRNIRPEFGMKAINDFKELSSEDKQAFLEDTKQFVQTESKDKIRSWGITLIGLIGGEDAFEFLVNFLQRGTPLQKNHNLFSRFFALVGIKRLASSEKQHNELQSLIDKIVNDKDEQGLIKAGAKIILASQGRNEYESELAEKLKDDRNYWDCFAILRALRELPLAGLTNSIISVMRNSAYTDIKYHSILALCVSDYQKNEPVIRALGEIVVTKTPRYLRLEAVQTLGRLHNRAAQSDLFYALHDEDAEIRVQAVNSLVSFLSKKEIIPILVQMVLEGEVEQTSQDHLIEAMRRVDPERILTTEILNKELTSQDRKRVQEAERILLELGGWAAVQRLSQLRHSLQYLDDLLAKSEEAVKLTFEGTIRQARFNFYFAMGVNILVVLVGLVLIILAIIQLIQHPEQLESWIIPGGAGVLGVLINLVFNNPRRNAREDLATLMKVNVGFLGFLRQLNEIDATFKHAYIENEKFGVLEMQETVQHIGIVVTQALQNLDTIVSSSQKPVSNKVS